MAKNSPLITASMQWSRWGWRWGSSSTKSQIFHHVKSHCVFVKVSKNWANALTMRIQKSHPMHCDVQHMHLDGAPGEKIRMSSWVYWLKSVCISCCLFCRMLQRGNLWRTICENIGWSDFAESIRARPNWTKHIIESTTSCFVRHIFWKHGEVRNYWKSWT